MAKVSSIWLAWWFFEVNLEMDARASSSLPCRTSHHGLYVVSVFLYIGRYNPRLWCKPADNEDGDWPNPLDHIRDSIGPFRAVVDECLENARRNQLSDDPAEVDIRCQVRSEHYRGDFGSVCCSQGLEDAPSKKVSDWHLAYL